MITTSNDIKSLLAGINDDAIERKTVDSKLIIIIIIIMKINI